MIFMKTHKKPSDIKVGVIGYGGAYNMGRQHLKEMQAAGMTPVAVAEVDASRLAVAEADFPGIGTYPSVSAMLEGSPVDMVVIITPHNTHAALAIECLDAGRHVVCEKPLAITTAEVDSMIKAAKKSGVMLSTYHNRHWDGRIRQAVELVKKRKVIGATCSGSSATWAGIRSPAIGGGPAGASRAGSSTTGESTFWSIRSSSSTRRSAR